MLRFQKKTGLTMRFYAATTFAFLVGLLTAAGQVLLLRELLALFQGYEPAAAALLAGWLLWGALGSFAAGRYLEPRASQARRLLVWLPWLMGLLGVACLLLARAAPLVLDFLGTPLGVRPSLSGMVAVSLLAPAPFCFVGGAGFAVAWRVAQARQTTPLQVYLAEALGAAVGGVVVFAMLALSEGRVSALGLLLGLTLPAWVAAVLYASQGGGRKGMLLVGALLFSAVGLSLPGLEKASLAWRFGPDAVAARDTPMQRVVLVQDQEQRSYFGGAGWLFSMPDELHAEWAVQPPLLLHEAPEHVLLLGGNPYALVREALEQPSVRDVDFLEPDSVLLEFLRRTLPSQWRRSVGEPGVRMLRDDPLAYLRETQRRYDVVLLNAGEPVNAQTSRLYSLEFFRILQGALAPGGLFCFSIPASPDALGPAQEAQLRSLRATAAAVFKQVRVILGGQAMFFCSDDQTPLPLDAAILSARLQRRGLALRYVREETLQDFLSPFKQGYVQGVLQAGQAPALNRVLRPAAYFQSAVLWLQELEMGRALRSLLHRVGSGGWWFWGWLALAAAVLALLRRPRWSVPLAVGVGGGAGMGLQLGALLAYQGLAGSLYSHLALLLGAWMAGLGLGAWLAGRSGTREARHLRGLAGVQFLLCLVLALGGVGFGLLLELRVAVPWIWLFTLLCLTGGIIGGAHFGLAARTRARSGATLYAVDLAGAALGSLLSGLLLAPLLGVGVMLGLFALLLAGSCVGLWRGAAGIAG